MADILGIISSNYLTVGNNVNLAGTKYVNVDPKVFEGSWTGKYANDKSFTVSISNIDGLSRQGEVSERRYRQIPGRADQGQRVPDRRFKVHGDAGRHSPAQDRDDQSANGSQTLETAYAKQG